MMTAGTDKPKPMFEMTNRKQAFSFHTRGTQKERLKILSLMFRRERERGPRRADGATGRRDNSSDKISETRGKTVYDQQ